MSDRKKSRDGRSKACIAGAVAAGSVVPLPKLSGADSVDAFVAIDVSGSMAGQRLADAKEALIDIEAALQTNDRLAVITFANAACLNLKPSSVGQLREHNELKPLLACISAQGLTAFWDAAYLALTELRGTTHRVNLTMLTDGHDNSSKRTLDDVLGLLARNKNVVINIVHAGAENKNYAAVCRMTSGSYRAIADTEIRTTLRTAVLAGAGRLIE